MWHGRLHLSLAFYILGISSVSAAAPVAALDPARQISPSEAATVSEFVASCDRDNWMCEYRMRMAVLNKIFTRGSICINDDHPRTFVVAWLKAHPETYKMETEDGLYTAYKSLYRCPSLP